MRSSFCCGLVSLIVSFFILGGAGAQAPSREPPQNAKGPQVGEVAPEPELKDWLQKPEGFSGKLADLRGKVVLLHTFAWNCGTCLKGGIPMAVNLREANVDRGLVAISITTPANREETLAVMRDKNITHAVALANPLQSGSPYVKMPVNPITYLFVIGRNGDVVWRGNPSVDAKGCVEAVQRALNHVPGRALDRAPDAMLAKAVQGYSAENYAEARDAAKRVSESTWGAKGAAKEKVFADANYLIDRIHAVGQSLRKDLESAVAAKDALKYVSAREGLRSGFAATDLWKDARQAIEAAEKEKEFAAKVKVAARWRDLSRARPALFPAAADDAASGAYAQALVKFIRDHKGSDYQTEAQALLDRFERR